MAAKKRASKGSGQALSIEPSGALPRFGVAEVLDIIVDALVERLVPRLAARANARNEICDQDSAPCDRRMFLEAARRGDFPSYRRHRRVFARVADVNTWMLSGTSVPKATQLPDLAPVGGYGALEDDVRRALGLKRAG